MSAATDTPHPDVATLIAFHCGRLAAKEHAVVQAHLARCRDCSGRLVASKPVLDDSRSADARDSDTPRENGSEVPPPLIDHPRYRIVGRLGEGGMGVVYKAEHRVMGRMVALKVLTAALSFNPAAMDRFRREVRLASRLSHPNIVTAFDADEAEGLHFLVMEFVDGVSLEKLVRDRGPLPVAMACEYVRQAAVGLQHAHEKGMVHRDVKPHNLMLTRTGVVKILDFGLARVADVEGADPASLTAMAITKPQTVLGPPDFFSPEQARGTTIDVRSDLYSLGCTLYYLLTGKPPFGGSGTYAKMIAHYKEPPPDLTVVRPDATKELADVIRKLMAKSADDRYQTPAEVAAVLLPFTRTVSEGVSSEARGNHTTGETHLSIGTHAVSSALPMATELEGSETGHQPTPPVTKRRGWILALAVLGVLGLGAAGVAVWMNRDKEVAGAGTPPDPSIADPKPSETLEPELGPPPRLVATVRKKQVLILVPIDFANGELVATTNALRMRGIGYLTVGPEKKTLQGYAYGGPTAKTLVNKTHDPDYGLKDVTESLLDSVDALLIVPGEVHTFGPNGAYGKNIRALIESMLHKKKVVGAIASGVVVLGWHGFLENSDVSIMPGRPKAEAQVKVKNWVNDPKVVIDLPFITTGVYSQAKELTEELVKAISDQK